MRVQTRSQYTQWIINSGPCWKCGVRKGSPCVSRFGNVTECHSGRRILADALRVRCSGPSRVDQDAISPKVITEVASKTWPDCRTPDQPIRPGEIFYAWKPPGVSIFRSRTKPVEGVDGILFWPLENP